MKDSEFRRSRLPASILLSLAMVVFLGACKGKDVEETKPIAPAEVVSLETLRPDLGEAKDDMSGVLDVAVEADGLTISYRYYDADLQNIDNDLVQDLAPKIQALYKDFKTINRVVFQISVNGETPGEYKPYSSFGLTRKIVGEIQWSGILAEDFIKAVLEHRRY